jgi:radical SAM superfamily enzyme YgiQ (UPF0313 family)
MKILFIYPKFEKYLETFRGKSFAGSEFLSGYSYPPALAIAALMAVTDERHECVFMDENIEEIDYDAAIDVVAVSFFTPQAGNAYRICSRFRERGKLVVVGGVHPSICREEAAEYADIVCIGEGERSWVQILSDIERGSWKKSYSQETVTDVNAIPVPRRSAYYDKTDRYDILFDYLELSRGCNALCDSCVVPKVSGREFRFKTIENIVADVRTLRYPMCFITDDVIYMPQNNESKKFLVEVFNEIGRSGYGKDHGFYISSTAMYPPDPDLLSAMLFAGARVSYFTFGFDPFSNSIMTERNGRFWRKMIDQARLLKDAGLLLYPAFHLGFDDHTPAIKDNILEFCREAGIVLAQFCMRMPWPGTIMWKQLSDEGRIIHTDWAKYNGSNVVFVPKKMSAEQLQQIAVDLWSEFSFNFHKLYKLQRTGVVDSSSLA